MRAKNMVDWAEKSRKLNPPLVEQYSKTGDKKEEKEAAKAMGYFVSDPIGSIYALKSAVPELFAGLLKARYSRTELSARQLLWREFVEQKENIPWKVIEQGQAALNQVFNYQRGEGVAERILLQYGDDSVFELSGAHLFLDRVSQVAAKAIEDARIGLSPLEKSTRYVVFDQKGADGDYSFYKDPKVMKSPHAGLFLETNQGCFDFYAQSVAKLQEYFNEKMPIESQNFPDFTAKNKLTPYNKLQDEKSKKAAQVAYRMSVRSKACDVARVLLPASTLTNIGEFGNARAYGYLFTKMKAMGLSEMQMIGEESVRELKKVLPKFLDVVDNPYGQTHQDYLRKTDEALRLRARKVLKREKPSEVGRVELVKMDKNPEVNIAAALLYPYSELPLQQLIKLMKKSPGMVGDTIHDSLKFRTNRRHKPLRAFEIAGYELVFDILGNFGIYRDLQRHRALTQQHQDYTTKHGYDMPVEFREVGLDKEFAELMEKVKKAHDRVYQDFPSESQYLTTMANYTRWYMGMNLREAFWLTELRSTPQGHFSYRTVAQDMFLKAKERYPFLEELKEFNQHYVDMSDRSQNLERMEAMQRIQTKLAAIEEKYS